jgi:hypothetical protein
MEAVRDALRHFGHSEALRQNVLLRSRLVIERAGSRSGVAGRVAALQDLLREAAESLQATPRHLKSYRALQHTYFHPAPTQEQAAELLDLPFSTYRNHLRAGMTWVGETLWQQEIGRPEK